MRWRNERYIVALHNLAVLLIYVVPVTLGLIYLIYGADGETVKQGAIYVCICIMSFCCGAKYSKIK